MVRQQRSEGQGTLAGRTPAEIVMRGGLSYLVVMGIELALAAVGAFALTQ